MSGISSSTPADELRSSWQGRALAATQKRPLGAVVLSVIAHSYDEAMETLLNAVFPGFAGLRPPGLCSAGKIAKTGAIMADIINLQGTRILNAALFKDTDQLQSAFRRLADDMKLDDSDRIEMFSAVRKWIVCDYRYDPTMDVRDPESRRYAVN